MRVFAGVVIKFVGAYVEGMMGRTTVVMLGNYAGRGGAARRKNHRPSGRSVILLPIIISYRLSGIRTGVCWKFTHMMHEEEGPIETRQDFGGDFLSA